MKVFSAPQKITLNVTNKCNLDCLYCAVSSTKNFQGDLSLEEWKKVIDELAGIKVFNVLISGGEPFCRPDLLEIIKHTLNYHFRISINTNGTLLDEAVLSILSGSNRLSNIQVSLDGPDSEVHDFIRGRGTFEKIIRGVDLLRRWNMPFSFFVVICKNNKNHLKRIVRLSKELGASVITFCYLLPQGSALSHLDDLFLSFAEQREVEAELKGLKKKYPRLVGGSVMQGIKQMEKISQFDVSRDPQKNTNKITSCGGSVVECSIRPDGWVIPCDRLWDYKVGNVREEGFQSIWLQSEGFRKFRERYQRTIDSISECKNCAYTGICRGGCPAIPYNMGKGIDGWDPLSCYMVFTGKKKSYV
jgi:SynChlorMet cassette radical SAM/SPASM protein ScmE